MQIKPYQKYIESGIEWIGKIPEEWEVRRFPSFGFFSSSGINKKTEPDEPLVKMVNYTDIYGNDSLVIDSKRELMTVSCPKGKIFFCDLKKGDIVFTPSSETEVDIGLSAVILENLKSTVFSYHVIRFRTNIKMNLHYKKYIGNNHFVLSQFSSICKGTTRQILTHNDFKSILTILPPFQDQIVIANFLDKKIAEIDDLIEKDKKLIELLKEKRTALINHAITKGLDQNVKMKDSGIEWISEIPEEWEVNKIKNTNYVKGRIGWHGLTSEEYQDEGAFLVTGTDFFNGHIDWSSCHHVSWERYKEDPYIHLKENDVLITKDGTIGKIALIKDLPDKATLNSGVFIIRPLNKKHISHFMFWVLNSLVFEKFFDYVKRGATISHLYQETFERFIFPIPSLDEQKAIAKYLDKHTARIDKTIQKIQKKINFLEEYKKSLIHHAVTGKIDVRGAEI